jgi:hypothetical protein
MAKATTATPKGVKATKVATTSAKSGEVILSAMAQRKVKTLRASRDAEKLAKNEATLARDFILKSMGNLTSNTIGTDTRGKRLVSVKVTPSPERIDWDELKKQNPELYNSVRGLIADYIIPKGAGDPTLRVDVI